MKRKWRLGICVLSLAGFVVVFSAVSSLSSDRFAQEPPMLWDELTVESRDPVFLFDAVRDILEARYTLTDIDEAAGRLETVWLVEQETGGKFRFVVLVEPGAVFIGREIVNPPRGNVSGDIYGSMLFFFLDVANRERDKVLEDITKGLAPAEAPEN